MRTFLTCLFLVVALAACKHGRDFARPSPESLVLGSTSRAEVEGNYGRPVQQSSAIRTDNGEGAGYVPATPFAGAFVAGSFSSISYVHSDETARIFYGGRTKAKAVNFVFWNDVLVGYDYVSTFDDDPTNFDETRINSIKKGQTTRSDLVQLLGQPTGRAVYPLIRDQGNEEFVYKYVEFGRSQRKSKTLLILFTADGTVGDVRFGSDTSPSPARPAGNYAPVPVIVTPHK